MTSPQRPCLGWLRALALAAALAVGVVALTSVAAPTVASAQDKIDLNTADVKALTSIRGVGKRTARRIIAYRDKNGPFTRLKQLMKVKGIRRKDFRRIAPRLTIAEPAEEEEVAADPELTGDAEEAAPEGTPEGTGGGLQRSNRMEFDGRLIRGQSAGAGAVFLFERAPRPLPSMVKRRSSYLDDTVTATLGDGYEPTEEAVEEVKEEIKAREESTDDK